MTTVPVSSVVGDARARAGIAITTRAAIIVLGVLAGPAIALAQPAPPDHKSEPQEPAGDGSGPGSGGAGSGSGSMAASANDAATRALEQRMQKLEDELAEAKDDNKYLEDKVQQLLPLSSRFSGYVDVGLFATTGNGAGTRSDVGNVYFPQYAGVIPETWVFMGDPLSTTVNSRGDVADTGESRAVTFDPINTHGKSTFLVNAVNFQMFSGIGDTATVQASIDFVPRARDISDPSGLFAGDYIDVKLAYAEWRPQLDAFGLALQVGKFDSVVGYEYRLLESPDRMTVTPSLLCRYTCGRPIGVKARAKFLDDALVANIAITNGSNFTENFDFSNETDQNQFKTGSGRLSYMIAHEVDIGISGAYGAQDWQTDDAVYQWHTGADVHAELGDLELTGELIHGRAKGKRSAVGPPCDVAACLDYTAWYALVGYRVTNALQPYFRVDYRDALHTYGASFVYISDLYRFTVGLRAELGSRVIAKVEATKVLETDGLPDFPDDVITSSLVIKY